MSTSYSSPFYVVEEFISPLLCEHIVDECDFTVPDRDKNGKEIKTVKTSEGVESIVYDRLIQLLPDLQAYYGIAYKGMEPLSIEWFPEGSKGELGAENSTYVRGNWLRVRQRDLTGVLFLSEYQDGANFEQDFEVYGGKLEFPQHLFGFNPKRGTLVVFPSDPHFINVTAPIAIGDLIQIRIQIAADSPFLYDPTKFPGNYTNWFGV